MATAAGPLRMLLMAGKRGYLCIAGLGPHGSEAMGQPAGGDTLSVAAGANSDGFLGSLVVAALAVSSSASKALTPGLLRKRVQRLGDRLSIALRGIARPMREH